MLHLMQRLVNRKDERGASAVEYGLLVAAIAAVIVIIIFALNYVPLYLLKLRFKVSKPVDAH